MPAPRLGSLLLVALKGRKRWFALCMNPLLFIRVPVPVLVKEREVVLRIADPLTPTPSGWAFTKSSHELSQASPCLSAHFTNSPDSDAMALTVVRHRTT